MIIKDIPKFESQDKLFDYLAENCDELIYEAKSQVKHADAIEIPFMEIHDGKNLTSKGISNGEMTPSEPGLIKGRLIINTTNIIDSHQDLHLPGMWNKSLKENKRIKHKQEHGSRFKDIIADGDDLHAFVKTYDWEQLGYDVEGKTQALVFDSNIREKRNAEMYKEYKDGNVDNHSVGMQYVKILLAMNSNKDQHAQYKINWDKYRPEVVNGEVADKDEFFWPVLEAKVREGSAVPDGSNPITPTMSRKSIELSDDKIKEKKLSEIKNFLDGLL